MGESAEVLLGEGLGPAGGAAVHWDVWVWLRVHGSQRPARHYVTDGQDLSDYYTSTLYAPGRGSGRPSRDWEDGDSEGSGEGYGTAVCGHQLWRGNGL